MFFRSSENRLIQRCTELLCMSAFKFIFICAVGLWVLRPLTGLLYYPRMIDDGGEIGGIKIGRGNRSIRRKPALA
jgi:hypothetical protein